MTLMANITPTSPATIVSPATLMTFMPLRP
jgi:hypothetical protein